MKNAAAPTTTTTTSSDHHVPNPQSDTQFPKLQSHSVDQRKNSAPPPKNKKTKNKKELHSHRERYIYTQIPTFLWIRNPLLTHLERKQKKIYSISLSRVLALAPIAASPHRSVVLLVSPLNVWIDFAKITLAKLCVRTCCRRYESSSFTRSIFFWDEELGWTDDGMNDGTDGWMERTTLTRQNQVYYISRCANRS
jgi:hypothetical protein